MQNFSLFQDLLDMVALKGNKDGWGSKPLGKNSVCSFERSQLKSRKQHGSSRQGCDISSGRMAVRAGAQGMHREAI